MKCDRQTKNQEAQIRKETIQNRNEETDINPNLDRETNTMDLH